MTRTRILLTGFGPFPGVPENASASLVAVLAKSHHADADVTAVLLPTEWQRGVAEVERALMHVKPDIALHFGVSERAKGFVIEEQALNACDRKPDARGALPLTLHLADDGPQMRHSTLPAAEIVQALEHARLPVARSANAGGYLCNAVLYASLASPVAAPLTGFIHMPTAIGHGAHLTADQALSGGRLILQACLAARQGLLKT